MNKTRLMIIDDSTVVRRMLVDTLNGDPGLEVVGTAPNGRIALTKIAQLRPDLVTLDIEMPELNGLDTLPPLRQMFPRLPVIMFSTLTEHGAAATLEALARGASDYVTKPSNVGSVTAAIQSIRDQLIPKIKAFCPSPCVALGKGFAGPAPPPARPRRLPPRIDLLVIGASTGGPQALTTLLSSLPEDFPVPIAVVQHMPPVFTRHLADRLSYKCALPVVESQGDEVLAPGRIWLAPGDRHLELCRKGATMVTRLTEAPPENSCRPSVDVLFRSAATLCGSRCLAVVLTGMGQDGMRGAQAIQQSGGLIFAQDQASSVVWGMPRAVVDAGLADRVLSLDAIGPEVRLSCLAGRRLTATPSMA
ncbi:MAG: chemotaxis response regulator protein-glutamate methylesterase [Pirellulaceae bacterium]